jgi:hypothetical protein
MTSSALFLLAGLAVQTPAPPQTPPASPVAEAYFLFLQGRQLQDQNDNEGAIAALKKALTLTPKPPSSTLSFPESTRRWGARPSRSPKRKPRSRSSLTIAKRTAFRLVQAALAART